MYISIVVFMCIIIVFISLILSPSNIIIFKELCFLNNPSTGTPGLEASLNGLRDTEL